MFVEILYDIDTLKNPEILIKKRKPRPSAIYDTYWRFAAERQEIFFSRIAEQRPPWTKDVILRVFKFTNAYRASDRVSQFLIKDVIYKGDQSPNEVFFRILLFKLFNKIETWIAIKKQLGEISPKNFNFKQYDKILTTLKEKGEPIYSGAYIMSSGASSFGHEYKHQNHLSLLETMLRNDFPEKVQALTSMETLYSALKEYPTIGSFLAYQFTVDINYSNLTHFSEMDFVKAGPGAQDGIRKCFLDQGEYNEEDIIRMMADSQELEFERLGITFRSLWGRPLQLIDCQNLFCEVDKYSRIAHPKVVGISNRKRIKQKFNPTSLKSIEYFYPPKWNLNALLRIG